MSLTVHSFAEKVLKGLSGEKGIVEPSFVYLAGVPGGDAIAKETGLDFFSVPIELGVRPQDLTLPKYTDKSTGQRCRESLQPTHQPR
jgi:hypothetical protein